MFRFQVAELLFCAALLPAESGSVWIDVPLVQAGTNSATASGNYKYIRLSMISRSWHRAPKKSSSLVPAEGVENFAPQARRYSGSHRVPRRSGCLLVSSTMVGLICKHLLEMSDFLRPVSVSQHPNRVIQFQQPSKIPF
jgi:hypothetical protein